MPRIAIRKANQEHNFMIKSATNLKEIGEKGLKSDFQAIAIKQ